MADPADPPRALDRYRDSAAHDRGYPDLHEHVLALWRANVTAQRSSISSTEQKSKSLGIWLQGRFATWTDEEKGLTAAIEILLPLAAVAFGITALGIVFDMTRAGVI